MEAALQPKMDKRNPLIYLFSKTWHYADSKLNIIKYWGMFIVANSIALVIQPLLLAEIIGTLQMQGVNPADYDYLCWLLWLIAGVTGLFWTLHGPGRLLERANAFKTRAAYGKFL